MSANHKNKNIGRPAVKNRTVSKTVRLTEDSYKFILIKGDGNFSDGLHNVAQAAIFERTQLVNPEALQIYKALCKMPPKDMDTIIRALNGVMAILTKES